MLKELYKDPVRCHIIHYSCESFITSHGKTPRVTSICIRNLKTGQTKSFSIHLQAQFAGLDFNNLTSLEYDTLEKDILKEFSNLIASCPTHRWLHWNMRDSNFGFEAINNRIKILKGKTFEIADEFKYDFPIILGHLYTHEYEKNKPKGRLLNLCDRNQITTQNALTGKEEADAFDKKEYLKLHLSTLKKVDIIASILKRIENGNLKVYTKKSQIYGITLPGLIAIVKETPWLLLIAGILGYIVGAVLEPVFQRLFHTV